MSKKLQVFIAAGAHFGSGVMTANSEQVHDYSINLQRKAQVGGMKGGRQIMHFLNEMRVHTPTNMRNHLLALQEIQFVLSKEDFDKASDVAEKRQGMTSLMLHGAHELAPYMPEGMKNIGSEMHRTASRLATAALEASATGDVKPVLEAMSKVTQQCIACHSAYRVQ